VKLLTVSWTTISSHLWLSPLLDQGILQVQLLNGGEIHGADRSGMISRSQTPSVLTDVVDLGKSDPFVTFTLDGQRVFKSQAKKKTLHPEWNETFSVSVVSVTLWDGEPLF